MARKYFSRFTPSLMSPEDLEGIFVQRQKLAVRLVDLIRESTLTAAKHYNLLIGPRGIGKTHLVSLVYHRLKKQEDLQDRLRIAWLSEEEYGVGTLLDLFLRILKVLIKEYYDANLEASLEQLYALSQEEAEVQAGRLLKQWIAGKTLLLIVENLDDLFSGLKEIGQKQLRSYLQENPFCTILATSPTIFNGISLQTSPFYGFFRNQLLDTLTPEEVKELLKKLAQQENNQELAEYLDTSRAIARIKAIHHLAGGCHRVYIIFYQFLNLESLENLTDLFVETLDELTPYYQSRMAYLSNQQRKIVEFLCETRNAVPVKEIARRCFLSHQATSSQLKEILEKGYVLTVPCGKESWYEIREPLMRFCLDIKHSRGTSAQLIIDFLKLWYSRGELEALYEKVDQNNIILINAINTALREMSSSSRSSGNFYNFADVTESLSEYLEKLQTARESGDQRSERESLIVLGKIHAKEHENDQAYECFTLALDLGKGNEMISEDIKIFNYLQKIIYGKRQSEAVIKKLETFIQAQESSLEQIDLAECQKILGSLYANLDNFQKAGQLLQQALAIKEVVAPGSLEVAECIFELAGVAYSQGNYQLAKDLCEQALELQKKKLSHDDLEIGKSLDMLASSLERLGNYVEAELFHTRSLVIREKELGLEHPDFASSLNNLALLYKSQGKYEQAEVLYVRSLMILEKELGLEHPNVATGLNNLAELYRIRGKYEQAEPLYMRSLMILEKELGLEHPLVATGLNNLALLYENQGKHEQAEPLYTRSVMIREKVLGLEHPDFASSLNNLALLYGSQGKYEQAEVLYVRSLMILEKVLGSEHPNVATSLNNLALLYGSQGKYEQAEALYVRSLMIFEKVLGSEHRHYAQAKQDLINLYFETANYKKLIILKRKDLEHLRSKNNPEELAQLLCELAQLYLIDRQYHQGLECISQFIGISSSLPSLEFSESNSLEFTLQEAMNTCLRLLSTMKATGSDLQTWLDRWKPFSIQSKQLEIPMRLLETWIRHRENKGDRRVLLSLPVEERRILEELIAGKTEEEDQ
jgi:Flp pilus assembly protein TadD/DNA-binding transcriptional ArsR family regulator